MVLDRYGYIVIVLLSVERDWQSSSRCCLVTILSSYEFMLAFWRGDKVSLPPSSCPLQWQFGFPSNLVYLSNFPKAMRRHAIRVPSFVW